MVQFSLSPEILDQIIFAMENQNDSFLFDASEGIVLSSHDGNLPEEEVGERYYDLPLWTSSDGFHLMEKFVASLRNPVYREQLRDALNSGRGVFRQFKNVLKQRDDIQRMWFNFKDKEMKNRVREWYDDLCEIWGIEKIGPEPIETEALVQSDFFIRRVEHEEPIDEYIKLDRLGFEEIMSESSESYIDVMYQLRMQSIPEDKEAWSFMVCETPEGDLAGVLWAVDNFGSEHIESSTPEDIAMDDPMISFIFQLYVRPEYRGMGLARTILEKFIEESYKDGSRRMTIKLWGKSQGFGRIFNELGFSTESIEYSLNLDKWGRENLLID